MNTESFRRLPATIIKHGMEIRPYQFVGQDYKGLNTELTQNYSMLEQQLKLIKQTQELGLINISPSLGDETIFHKFPKAKCIDLLFFSGKTTFRLYSDSLRRAVAENACCLRIIVCDPSNRFLTDERISDSFCPGTNIIAEIGEVRTQVLRLTEKLKEDNVDMGSVELRFSPTIPTISILIVDNKVARFTSYIPYSHSTSVPSYDVTAEGDGKLFTAYKDAFERMWNKSLTEIKVDYTQLRVGRDPTDSRTADTTVIQTQTGS